MTADSDAWEQRGRRVRLGDHDVFVVDTPPTERERHEPLLVIHGFPTSSFDFHLVVDELARHRRVVLFDMVGFGLSDKPDLAYTVDLHADVAEAVISRLGIDRLSLLTHDLGDTIGGELLARHTEGRWPVTILRRVLTNGSIYIAMARLSLGQQFLLSLPDERLPDDAPLDLDALAGALALTFSPSSSVPSTELAGHCQLITRNGGNSLLPRTIRYIEERRRREARFTGAIERHASPLSVIWGVDDPIAVVAMADCLRAVRPDVALELLDGVGHYPMIESPDRFVEAVLGTLA